MKILKGILKESEQYYLNIKKNVQKRISSLPEGSIKERKIGGKKYYYLQKREEGKVVQKYLGKDRPADILKQIEERRRLRVELKKVNEALKVLKRAEGRKRG